MKSGKKDLGQGTGGETGGLVQGARAGTEKLGNAGPLSLQILRIDGEGIIDIKMHLFKSNIIVEFQTPYIPHKEFIFWLLDLYIYNCNKLVIQCYCQ